MGRGNGRGLRGVAILSTIGIALAACVSIGALIGWYLDRWLGTEPWLMVLFFLLGTAAGFIEVFRIANRSWNDNHGAGR
ncbi:MAG: AtpZ/AtpI family protein [Armatimonadota bacterium]